MTTYQISILALVLGVVTVTVLMRLSPAKKQAPANSQRQGTDQRYAIAPKNSTTPSKHRASKAKRKR